MSYKSNLPKANSNWNDSMNIFFSPKLILQGKNLFPQIIDTSICYKQQNFLTVNKKPIINICQKIITKNNQKKNAVLIIGEAKQIQKRNHTTENKRKHLSVQLQQQLMKNYRQTIIQINQVRELQPKKGLSFSRLFHSKQQQQKQKYYFYIGPGNNAQLVQQILTHRNNWIQTNSSLYHFRWQQYRPKYQNSTINKQLINHLPNHQVISDKVGLVNSLKYYCQKHQQDMFNIIPNCFYFDFGNLQTCQNQIKKFIQFFYQENQRIQKIYLLAEQIQQDQKIAKQLSNSPKKIVKNQSFSNITSNTSNISSPNKYTKNLRKQLIPTPNPQSIKKKQQIKKLHLTLLTQLKTFYAFVDMSAPKKQNSFISPIHNPIYGNTSLWLLKPADLNRGRGIHLFRTIQQLGSLLRNDLSKHQKGSFLIQKYIQKPMLINNRKFDIRVYSLITQSKQLYFFKQGYIRTSSTTFQVNSPNYFTHLTNNAIQKYSKNYGQFQQGNILPLNYLFRSCGLNKQIIYQQIKRKIKLCTKAGFSKMFSIPQKLPNILTNSIGNTNNISSNSSNKIKYFQIFGYDFMVDETSHVWLIQVNTNPCLQLSNQWLKSIIPRMLQDAFKLTLDKLFPRKKQQKQCKQNIQSQTIYHVPQYSDTQLMWQYLDLRIKDEPNDSTQIIN